jgi:peptidyl-prolyl cis-trans isomerase A (cyclophilin A)
MQSGLIQPPDSVILAFRRNQEEAPMTRNILPALIAASVFLAGLAMAQAPAANPKVLLKTTKGDITIELYPAKAPITVKNILGYVEEKFYDGLIFHRVIPDFMIQCGGMTPEMHQKSGKAPIKNESGNGLTNARGMVAMARTNELDSATSQFYINLVDNFRLDEMKYCAFGKVIAGMEVVDAIAKVPTGSKRGQQNVPLEPVTILSATVVK